MAIAITVTGRHMEVTPAIRDYAEEKAAKLERYYDALQGIEVVADRSDPNHYAVEMIASIPHHQPLVASNTDTDLYASIDAVVDKLERQLTDHKEKIRNRKHNPGARP
jgi:putative sigma-54 modulation protein